MFDYHPHVNVKIGQGARMRTGSAAGAWLAAAAALATVGGTALAATTGKVLTVSGRPASEVVKTGSRYNVNNPGGGVERGFILKKNSRWIAYSISLNSQNVRRYGEARRRSATRYDFLRGRTVKGRVDRKGTRWAITIGGKPSGSVTGLPGGPAAAAALLTYVYQLG